MNSKSWLAALRQEKMANQSEVAYEAKISVSYYSMIESGKRRPSTGVAQRIAQVLGFDWTLFYSEPDQPQQRGA